jgi:hypothetical protein
MIDRAALALERRVDASPIWVRLRDTFTKGAPLGPVKIRLETLRGQEWVPLEHPHRLSSGGDLAVIGLGRSRDPASVGTFPVRVWVSVPGSIAEPQPVELAVTAWRPEAPSVPAGPTDCELHPGPTYRFPPGTPVLTGTVVLNNGTPVDRAVVRVTETVNNTSVTEQARTDELGAFRLALRWSAGATTVVAQPRPPHPPLAGSINVNVPADLSSIHQIVVV